jgi:hypothetical protein
VLDKDQVNEAIVAACPHCGKGLPVEFRSETQEFVHRPLGPMSITLCLATNLRQKYQDVLNG